MPDDKDILYILKPDLEPEELRYSLRSVEKNLPHRRVWFAGGQPRGFAPDGRIIYTQQGASKWDKIKNTMLWATKCEDLSEWFYLFNDDFFVMKPFEGEFINYIDGTLEERIEELKPLNPWLTPYARTIYKANEELKTLGKPTLNYEVHLPMLMHKPDVARLITTCSSPQMRSIYGNLSGEPYIQHKDVKVYDVDEVPDDNVDFLSTSEDIFAKGRVGVFIRERFPEPSRFEV